jgi:hypothetical protein
MMNDLGVLVKNTYPDERVLCIGFAETATAIGSVVARFYDGDYIHTTREHVGAGYFSFSEEHSHASEQKLCADRWEELTAAIDRIVFVEDEISTGKTILNGVSVLRKNSNGIKASLPVSAASLINLMNDADMQRFTQAEITPLYLLKAHNQGFDSQADLIAPDRSRLYDVRHSSDTPAEELCLITAHGKRDPRRGVQSAAYQGACHTLAAFIAERLELEHCGNTRMLVLGTEECMFPALYAANYFETINNNISAYTHATTRSPIMPSGADDYPISRAYCLRSVYEEDRMTFLYNLDRYDSAVLITDSEHPALNTALGDIHRALLACGTKTFCAVRWIT